MAIGHFQFSVMPFGLTSAQALLQGLINDVLWDLLHLLMWLSQWHFDFVPEEHIQPACQISSTMPPRLQALCQSKKRFVFPLVFSWLAQGQCGPDPAKIEVVANWQISSSRKQLQQCLGYANFDRGFFQNRRLCVPHLFIFLTVTLLSPCAPVWTKKNRIKKDKANSKTILWRHRGVNSSL